MTKALEMCNMVNMALVNVLDMVNMVDLNSSKALPAQVPFALVAAHPALGPQDRLS